MTEKKIVRFEMEFEVSDAGEAFKKRDEWERYILQDMSDRGYIPVLDLPPVATTNYDKSRGVLLYKITIQGTYVGKRKSKEFSGIWQGRLMKDTQENK